MTEFETEVMDLNNFEMPIYSIDREENDGIPQLALTLADKIKKAEGMIISFAEHNSSYTVAFKNVLDWMSRSKIKPWQDKKMLLLSTSPGGRGGKSVLTTATTSFPHFGANVIASFSLPSYHKNFSEAEGIVDASLKQSFDEAIQAFSQALKKET